MRTLRLTGDAAEAAVLAGCTSAWERLHARIAHRFGRVEVRARVRRFVAGLLARVERKHGWQLAEAIGEVGPQGVQRLLNGTTWDADALRDDLRTYVVEHLGDLASGVLIIDETSFPKKGSHSCGVAPQYCGTLGHRANAQVAVFLAYTSVRGTACIDRALYLPHVWTRDVARCVAAGVPADVGFATKIALATQLVARAFAAAVPARWQTSPHDGGSSPISVIQHHAASLSCAVDRCGIGRGGSRCTTRFRNKANPARPYICLLSSFKRWICASVCPLL